MLKDYPMAIFWRQKLHGFFIRAVQVHTFGLTSLNGAIHVADEGAGFRETFQALFRCHKGVAATRDQFFRLHSNQVINGRWPIFKIGITGVRCCTKLDQITTEQDFILGQPGDGVTFGVTTANLFQLNFNGAKPDSHFAGEGLSRPRQAGYAFNGIKQTREALIFRFVILLAALNNQITGIVTGNDMLWLIAGRAQNPDRMVMGQHNKFNRQVSHRADLFNHQLGHNRRRLGIQHHDTIITDDHAGVWITFGGEGIGMLGQLGEGDFLFFHIRLEANFFSVMMLYSLINNLKFGDTIDVN